MRVLVTGGAGFVGSNIVDALAARGDGVVALDDLSTGDRGNLAPDIALRVADISEHDALFDAVHGEGFDVIVHAAAKTKVVESMAKAALYERVIVKGTSNVVRLAEDRHVQMLVNLSTGGAMYGETPECASEETPARPDSNYGRFKLEAEALVARAEVPSISLRLANVYGRRQRQDLEGGVIAIFLGCWRRGEPLTIFGDGTAERDYIHVDDVASAVLGSFAGRWTGVYNVGTGVATSVNALIEAMSGVLGPPPGIHRAPPRAVEVQRSCLSSSKAARDGLWEPRVPLRDGLRLLAKA